MTHTPLDLPGALVSIAIEAKAKADQETLTDSLRQLVTEDPSLHASVDRETGLTIISGLSDLHLGEIVDRLRREFKIDTNVGKPQVVYKETIRSSVEREARFVRQTSGHRQYAHVVLRVEPLKGERIFEFIDATNGALPNDYITAVESGVEEVLRSGVLVGYPMIGIKVTLLDGSYHESDSSEIDFKIAGSMAFKEAVSLANPVVLEPLMSVEVVIPEEFTGEVVGNLAARRGTIQRMESRDGAQVIGAEVPLARMFGYTADLHLITQGRATYSMRFKAYVEVNPPPDPDGNEPASMALRVA